MLQKNKKQNLSLSNRTHKITPSQLIKSKLTQHSKTNSNNESNRMNQNQNSYQPTLYNTRHTLYHTPAANTEIIINLILSKVDLPKIRRSTSIPVVITNQSRLSNGNGKCQNVGIMENRQRGLCQGGGDGGQRAKFLGEEEEEEGVDQEEVLSPRKVRRCTVSNFQEVKSKACSKQKIVILSTSRLNPQSNIKIKHPIKTKILNRLNSKASTLPNQSQPHRHNLQIENIHSMPPIQQTSNTCQYPLAVHLAATPTAEQQNNHNKVMKDIYKIVEKVKMQQFIEGDRQLLKLFPAIDLELLVVKIKNEEILRKSVGIAKWSYFDYCNVKDW